MKSRAISLSEVSLRRVKVPLHRVQIQPWQKTQYERDYIIQLASLQARSFWNSRSANRRVFHRAVRRPYSVSSTYSEPSTLEVRPSINKGLGIFATQNIPAHKQIVSDHALLSIGLSDDLPEVLRQYSNLSAEVKRSFLQFHAFNNPERDRVLADKLATRGIPTAEIPEMVRVSSVFTSNAFNVGDTHTPASQRRAMFPTISRINHSCVPNAHTIYIPHTGRMLVHTLSAIAKGDEVEISYFNLLLPSQERQARAAKWGFECHCPACDLRKGTEQAMHESCRAQIRQIEIDLQTVLNNANVTGAEVSRCVGQAEEMTLLALEHDSLQPQLPIAYDYLATSQMLYYEFTQNAAVLESIDKNLRLALAAEINITGDESPPSRKRNEKIQMFADVRAKLASVNATDQASR